MSTLGPKKDGGPNVDYFQSSECLAQFDQIRVWLQKNCKKHVQTDPPTKEGLAQLVIQLIQYQENKLGKNASDPPFLRLPILVALSFYATGSYQRIVGGTHGTLMSQQSVSKAIRDVTNALNDPQILHKFVVFPQNRQQRDQIKRNFYEKFGIPAVIGCIDGTHIAMVRPKENEERFYNRKHYHSRNVQIICDSDLNILSVDASFGGATHDSFIWNQHPIKDHLVELINGGEITYLLGDSGYAQREYMMTPIIDAVAGSPEEHYTNKHCSARSTVERTIGVLKQRWRCLLRHRVLHYKPDVVAKIVNACCVLHNFCNKHSLPVNTDTPLVLDDAEQMEAPQPPQAAVASIELRRGTDSRAALVQQLWSQRQSQ